MGIGLGAQVVTLLVLIVCFAGVVLVTPRIWGANVPAETGSDTAGKPAGAKKREKRAA
jgi:hypothetical protein